MEHDFQPKEVSTHMKQKEIFGVSLGLYSLFLEPLEMKDWLGSSYAWNFVLGGL